MSDEATQNSGNPAFSKNPSPGASPPTVAELEGILRNNRVPLSRIDEVWPNLYIGDMTVAHDRFRLWKLGITHVLNAAHKQIASSGCQDFYGCSMDYYGIAASDVPHFDIAAYFYSASEYIHRALDIMGELETILESSRAQLNHVDEVWPNLYIGDLLIAHDRKQLRKMGITHVLNAAHSKWGSKGDQIFYGKKINYCGIAADDSPDFDLSMYFYTAAEQIHQTLNTPDAKLLVHCILGMSRSASLVLAYLMIYHNRSLLSAVDRLILYRPISPNRGFLEQLRNLDIELNDKKKQQLAQDHT
uniref:dual specificity protein phosphatase 13A-like isoform X1 n=1 Tax=Pristiophorus japonicus TaxID=55135 RepID=UPI00398E7C58